MKRIVTALTGLTLATPVMAHPGHDEALVGVAHYLLSPVHGLMAIGAAVLVALVLRRKTEEQRNE